MRNKKKELQKNHIKMSKLSEQKGHSIHCTYSDRMDRYTHKLEVQWHCIKECKHRGK